ATPAIGMDLPCHHCRIGWKRALPTSRVPSKAPSISPALMLRCVLAIEPARRAGEIGPNERRCRSSSASGSSASPNGRTSTLVSCPPVRVPALFLRSDGSTDLLHDVVGNGVVRVHVLHVVRVLERLDQPEHFLCVLLIQVDLDRREERAF